MEKPGKHEKTVIHCPPKAEVVSSNLAGSAIKFIQPIDIIVFYGDAGFYTHHYTHHIGLD
jgi:hypothetical protein